MWLDDSEAWVAKQGGRAESHNSSASEMARKAGTGMEMDLDLVPQKEKNMSAYELMLSESQERMLHVVKQGREEEIINIFNKHDVEAVAIGHVLEEKSFRIKQHDQVVADIPVDALVEEVPVYNLPAKEAGYFQEFQQ